jgi:four helix bundle protein
VSKISEELSAETMRELNAPAKPMQRSRTWQNPQGYRYLVQWSNAVLLRYLIRLFTSSLPKSEYRRKAQIDDAGRSTVRNIEEGYKRSNTSTYIEFISFSQGSLEEVKGDVRELTEDGFFPSRLGTSLRNIGIDLKDFNTALKPRARGGLEDDRGELKERGAMGRRAKKPDPDSDSSIFLYRPITILYSPLARVRAQDLTYEIFMELINKTDYLLRVLVESLERKLKEEKARLSML